MRDFEWLHQKSFGRGLHRLIVRDALNCVLLTLKSFTVEFVVYVLEKRFLNSFSGRCFEQKNNDVSDLQTQQTVAWFSASLRWFGPCF